MNGHTAGYRKITGPPSFDVRDKERTSNLAVW